MLMKLHLTELEYVVLEHTPQFEVLIEYSTPDMFVDSDMESHVKVSWSVLISNLVTVKNLQKMCNYIIKKFYAHIFIPDGVPICLLPTICPLLLAHSIVLPNKYSLMLTRSCEVKDLSAAEILRPTIGGIVPHDVLSTVPVLNWL